MVDSRTTWYSRVSSWNPLAWISEEVSGPNKDVEESETTSTEIDIDSSLRRVDESLKRRNALRSKINRKQRKFISSQQFQSKYHEVAPIVHSQHEIRIPKTFFDLYHPWKIEPLEKSISCLPSNIQPLFCAAIEGNLKFLQEHLALLKCSNPTAVHLVDEKGRSPIHLACAFGHFEIVLCLLSEGANPNAVDHTGSITPLICASVNGSEQVIDLLLENGAEINYGLDHVDLRPRELKYQLEESEPELHTALSWAVKAGNFNAVNHLLSKGALLAGTTINWETPLHHAAYCGNVAILKLLVEHERNLQSLELRGGRNKNTALHIAVEQGHLECTELLLSLGAKPNKENVCGQTPVHIAAIMNDVDSIQLLLKFGADVQIRDTRDRSALHYCIRFATPSNYIEAIECIDLLLSHGADINAQDENGFTPFHAAVDTSASTIVATLLTRGADLTLLNNSGQSGVEMLVKKMPHAIRYIRESLDFAVSVTNKDIADPECSISLDFRPIIVMNAEKTTTKLRKETELLSSFCAFGHNDILSHPLIEAFLILKWERVIKYFWASFIANMMLVLTFSFFIVRLYKKECPLKNLQLKNLNFSSATTSSINLDELGQEMPLFLKASCYLLFLMISVFIIKEFLQMFSSPKTYFYVAENYAQLLFIVLAVVSIFPYPLGPIRLELDLCSCLSPVHYGCASVGVIVAWGLILLRIGKLPKLGLYVQMLFKVVGNFGKFIIAYASIVIAFALSFGIVLDEVYHSIFHSFFATVVMMTGEIGLDTVIPLTQDQKPLPVVTYMILITFVLLVTVVLMNLLVGLAVSDIQGLREGAKVARLSRLVFAISQLESMLFSNGLINLLPKRFVHRVRKNALFAHKDSRVTFNFRPHDPRDKTIPKYLQFEALRILERRENEKIRSLKKANQTTDNKEALLKKIDKLEIAVHEMYEILKTHSSHE